MSQTIILAILLVFVYQYEEIVWALGRAWSRVRHKQSHQMALQVDSYVGTVVTLALMPMLLFYVLSGGGSFMAKLLWVSLIYLVFGILVMGVGFFASQVKRLAKYHGTETVLPALYLVGGIFFPTLRLLPWGEHSQRIVYARLALLLSVPPLLGAIFSKLYQAGSINFYYSEYFESLIIIMVGGLFINIIVHVLEKYFKRVNVGVLGMYRIVLGLVLALVIFVQNN